MEDISQLRQQIYQLNKERWELTQKNMSTGKLLTASFYERYTKCGNPNCKCAKGERHGPFPWIYENRKGKKLISTSCKEDKVEEAAAFSSNYKLYKKNNKKIISIDNEITKLLIQVEKLNTVSAVEFTKKKGEKRGRKQKESDNSSEK